MSNFLVTVYDTSNNIIVSWCIDNRAEQQATKEAMHEIERRYPCCDWTITEEKGEKS